MRSLASFITPTPRQRLVLDCPVFEILYGGAKGGGKSELLLLMVLWQAAIAHEYWKRTGKRSRGRAVLFRKDFTRIEDLLFRSHILFKAADPEASYHVGTHRWTFSSGYRMYFIQLEKPGAEESQQGQEISLLLGDQAEEVPYAQYKFLRNQVRSTDPALQGKERIVITANPIGEYVMWLKEMFVDGKKPHEIYENVVEFPDGTTETLDYTFIPAKPKDNPHLTKRYWAVLMQLDEDERRAYLDGDWNVTFGSFFGKAFVERDHVRTVAVPRYGDLFMHGDWGSTNPAAWYLSSRDGDNNIVTHDEIYGPGETGRVWGTAIIERLKMHGLDPGAIVGHLDDQAWHKHEDSSPGEKMVQMGLCWFPVRKPPGSRAIGWVEMKERLRHRGGERGRRPGWLIDPRCENLIKQIKVATKDQKDPEDIMNGHDFHALDGARYGLTAYPLSEEQRVGKNADISGWERQMEQQAHLRAGLATAAPAYPQFQGYE